MQPTRLFGVRVKQPKKGGLTLARPQKEGLAYFSLDVDFFSDRKVKILKGRFGADGITYYLYLLCEI